MNPTGKWDYTKAVSPFRFGEGEAFDQSYRIGMSFLAECPSVEDWGCGATYAKQFCQTRYVGVDANPSPWTDVTADLNVYRSSTPGLFMRHVLEHNEGWAQVLDNAVASFTQRMALIFYIPFAPVTRVRFRYDNGVPDIEFSWIDITSRLKGLRISDVVLLGKTGETVFLLEK